MPRPPLGQSAAELALAEMRTGSVLTHNGNGKYTDTEKPPGARRYSGRTMASLVRAGLARWGADAEGRHVVTALPAEESRRIREALGLIPAGGES